MIREPWIRVHANLYDKKVTARLADALNVAPHEAIGLLVTFWGNVSENADNGHVSDLPNSLLERWARWSGKRGAFADWVKAHHVDESGRVKEWDAYQGALEQRRDKDKKRVATWRERHANGTHDVTRTVRVTDPEPNANGTRSVRTHARETVRDGTVQTTKTKALSAAPTPWVVEGVTIWTTAIGAVSHGKFGKLVKPLVDDHDWESVKAGLADYLAATPPQKARLEWFVERGTYWVKLAKQPGVDPKTGMPSERSRVIMGPVQ